MHSRKARHVAAVAVLGLAAVTSLAACRVEQGAALFVGDTRITEAQVSEVVDSLPADEFPGLGGIRSQVVEAMLIVELGKQVTADTDAEVDTELRDAALEQLSQGNDLPKDNPVVALFSESAAYRAVLLADAEPAEPTEADAARLDDRISTAIGAELTKTEKAQVDQIIGSDEAKPLLGQVKQLDDYIAEYDVSANPRYGEAYLGVPSNFDGDFILFAAPVPS